MVVVVNKFWQSIMVFGVTGGARVSNKGNINQIGGFQKVANWHWWWSGGR